MTFTREQIEQAILSECGNPDTGAIRDNLGVISTAVLGLIAPDSVELKPAKDAKTESKTQETRIITVEETR